MNGESLGQYRKVIFIVFSSQGKKEKKDVSPCSQKEVGGISARSSLSTLNCGPSSSLISLLQAAGEIAVVLPSSAASVLQALCRGCVARNTLLL